MAIKDTIENMHRIAEQRGGKCLSSVYGDMKTPLLWECAEGHAWEATPGMVKGSKNKPGTWCKICGLRSASKKRMYTIEQMQIWAEKKGGSFASSEYRGSQIKHRWRCNQHPLHPEFEMIPNAVQQGQWCGKCSGNAQPTLSDLDELAKSKHPLARCVSQTYYNSSEPLEWECGIEGHPPFLKSYASVKHEETWCLLCKEMNRRSKKYDQKYCIDLAKKYGGKLISKEPLKRIKQILQWECTDGHLFSRSLDSIISYQSFCPTCNKTTGVREEYIRELFFYMFDKSFERTRQLPWLRNKEDNAMELDGYNADLSIAFEHNGEQHYRIDGFYIKNEERLKKIEFDDALKLQLCRENKVTLIVVPFYISMNDIQNYVVRELDKVGIIPLNIAKFLPGIVAPSQLKKFRQIAANHEGELLSEKYGGCSEKLQFKCKNLAHPPFMITPSAITSGKWCRKCFEDKASESYRVPRYEVQKWAQACGGELVEELLCEPMADATYALSDQVKFHCLKCGDYQLRMIRYVKDGRLCFCDTNKKRIVRNMLIEKLIDRDMKLVTVGESFPGRSNITIHCNKCNTSREVKTSHVINNQAGCKNCSRNAPITIEKARELGERIGYHLKSSILLNGKDLLIWECIKCSEIVKKSFRKMRNIRSCNACAQHKSRIRLGLNYEGKLR